MILPKYRNIIEDSCELYPFYLKDVQEIARQFGDLCGTE
jgi:hypothetical protein